MFACVWSVSVCECDICVRLRVSLSNSRNTSMRTCPSMQRRLAQYQSITFGTMCFQLLNFGDRYFFATCPWVLVSPCKVTNVSHCEMITRWRHKKLRRALLLISQYKFAWKFHCLLILNKKYQFMWKFHCMLSLIRQYKFVWKFHCILILNRWYQFMWKFHCMLILNRQ